MLHSGSKICVSSAVFLQKRLTFGPWWGILLKSAKYGPVAQLGERSVRIREVKGSNPSRSTIRRIVFGRCGVSFCLSLQNRASFVLTAQNRVCSIFRHNAYGFTCCFVKNDNSPIRSTQPPNGCLFKVRFPPTRSTHRERMTLKFFKLLQRYIKNDLDIIVASDTDFLDELVEDCLPLLKGCVLIGACPSEQIAAIIFSFLVFLLNLLQLVLCSGQGILCCLAEKIRFRTSSAVYPSCTCRCRWCSWDKRTAASPGSFAGLSLPTR